MKNLLFLSILCLLLSTFVKCTTADTPKDSLTSQQMVKGSIEVVLTEGTNMAVAVSPNQEQLVIDLQGQLWILPITGGEAHPITNALHDARQPHWSPDGARICFQGYRDGNWHIYSIRPNGKDLQQYTSGIYDHREPQWSPDGKWIICSSDREGTYDIWKIDISTKELEQLTSDEGDEYAPTLPNNGQKLAYISNAGGTFSLLSLNISTTNQQYIYKTENQLFAPQWDSSTEQLSFNELTFSESELKTISTNAAGQNSVQLSLEEEDIFPFRINWLNENGYIYTSDGKIYRAHLVKGQKVEGREKKEIPFQAKVKLNRPNYPKKQRDFDSSTPQKAKGIYAPIIAPNGKQIAFVGLQDVYLQNVNGLLEQLTDDAGIELSPTWSPDGKQLAYISDKGGQWAIWTIDIKTKSTKKLNTIGGSPNGLSWSPDGSTLAYTVGFGPRLGQLWLLDVETGTTTNRSGNIVNEVGVPSWSADGSVIAVSSMQPYSTLYREGIMRMLYFTKVGKEKWMQKGLPNWSMGVRGQDGPIWSPNGKYMATISQGVLWLVPVDAKGKIVGDPQQLTKELADSPTWTTDSKFILYKSEVDLKIINIDSKETKTIPIDLKWKRYVPNQKIVIHAGGLFDGSRNEIQKDVDVVIENNRIVAIEAHDKNRTADRIIDASDAYLMSGLIDIHAHQGSWGGEILGRQWLAWGVTSSRDPATNPYDALNRKEATASGHYLGPRIFFTGSPIDGSRVYYSGTYAQQSLEQIELELGRAKALGYDMIKTYVRLADPIQKRVVEYAHELGVPVSSHELYPAVSYGVDGVEHILGTSRRGYSPKMTSTFNSYQDVITLLSKSGMSYTPTVGIYVSYPYLLHKDPSVLEDERLKKLYDPFVIQSANAQMEAVKQDEAGWKKNFENAAKVIKSVHDQGGLVCAGTDGPILPFGFGLHMEMLAYQEAGLSPYEVLRTATINSAKVLGNQADMGTVEVEKLADLIIVKKNPLEDVRHVKEIEYVIKNGVIHHIDELINLPYDFQKND